MHSCDVVRVLSRILDLGGKLLKSFYLLSLFMKVLLLDEKYFGG